MNATVVEMCVCGALIANCECGDIILYKLIRVA
jgi:hypothetical protein